VAAREWIRKGKREEKKEKKTKKNKKIGVLWILLQYFAYEIIYFTERFTKITSTLPA
jgi:hypothetical protein